jgi:ABC-type transporter MlaC component
MTQHANRGLTRRLFSGTLVALLLGGTSLYPASARAALEPAETYVSRIADDVMSLANSGQTGKGLQSKFAALMNRYINLRAIANYALGPYRSKIPADKKEEFYRLVATYAAALFAYYVEDFRGTELDILSTDKQGKFITINSAIKLKGGGREQVRWRLVPASGGFRVSDVNLKGVWLTISMRKRFGDVLKKSKGDLEPLFAELREAQTW